MRSLEQDPKHWDCECVGDNYIRCKHEKKCHNCGALRDSCDSPDSRVNEVGELLGKNHNC